MNFSQYYDSNSDREIDDKVNQYLKSKVSKNKDINILQ